MESTTPVMKAMATASTRMTRSNTVRPGMQVRASIQTGGTIATCSVASAMPAQAPDHPLTASL